MFSIGENWIENDFMEKTYAHGFVFGIVTIKRTNEKIIIFQPYIN
jgi:hypothetical protein